LDAAPSEKFRTSTEIGSSALRASRIISSCVPYRA
jgi:hypothetical protein